MSTHTVNIVAIDNVLPHGNAERLEIIPVGRWQAVSAKGQFRPGDRAIYIEPDYVVPTVRPELGIERYEPPIKLAKSDELPSDQWPKVFAPKFDVENIQRFPDVIERGEPVVITEKIHGANARFLCLDGVFYMGSRTRWLKPDAGHEWKRAADADPRIEAWCRAHPGIVLYGEIYGSVQSLKYGASKGEIRFAAFAAIRDGDWIMTFDLHDDRALPTVPLIYCGPFDPDLPAMLAEQDSTVDGAPVGHMREGVVIVSRDERRCEEIGRIALKNVSNRYWESAA